MPTDLGDRALEHIVLVVIATLVAAAIAIPAGVAISRRPKIEKWALGFASIAQTIPSLTPGNRNAPVTCKSQSVRREPARKPQSRWLPPMLGRPTPVQSMNANQLCYETCCRSKRLDPSWSWPRSNLRRAW